MKFKFPSALTVLFAITVFVAILTWIVPTGRYAVEVKEEVNGKTIVNVIEPENVTSETSGKTLTGTYKSLPGNKQGLASIFTAPIKGFYDAKEVIVFVLVLGGFINIAMSTNSIDSGIISLMRRLHGHEKLAIPILMTIFAAGGTSYGMGEETIALYPVLIPVMLAVGYDTITAMGVIALGAGIGTLASTVNPFATSIASEAAGISIGNGLGIRTIMLLSSLAIGIAYVMIYAAKVKANPSSSLVFDTMEEDKKFFLKNIDTTKSQKEVKVTSEQRWILRIFIFSFAFMIYSLIPFSEIGITFLPELGWYFPELSAFFLAMSIIMGIVGRMSETEFTDSFIAGVKDIVSVAIVIGVARGIKVVMTDGMIADTMLFWAEQGIAGLSSSFFVIGTYIAHLFLSIFIPSSSGLAAFSIPIIAPMADIVGVGRDAVVTAYQSASGLVNLFSPTSFILMSALQISRVPLNKWIKFVAPLIAILFIHNILFLILSISI